MRMLSDVRVGLRSVNGPLTSYRHINQSHPASSVKITAIALTATGTDVATVALSNHSVKE